MHASELSYRRLFESAKDGILILEADTGQVSDVNPSLLEMLGFFHRELVGRHVWELEPFRDLVANEGKFEELQAQGYVRCENLSVESRDGRKIAIEFVSNVYQAGDHNVIQCNIRDISDRKRVEEQIRVLHAQLEQRVIEQGRLEAQLLELQEMAVIAKRGGVLAHDLNNGLAVIMGYTDLIRSHLESDGPMRKYTEEIGHACERAADLTRQMLCSSRKKPDNRDQWWWDRVCGSSEGRLTNLKKK